MRLFDDLFIYPWLSYEQNNCNTIFIDGPVPTLIDPGHRHLFQHVVDGMMKDGRSVDSVKLVLSTHGHPDHIEALQIFDNDVLKAISMKEISYLQGDGKNLYLMTGCQMPGKPFQFLLKEGRLKLGGKTFRVIETPGHSPGSVCLYWEEKQVLVSGDTVFSMGVGRTDLPGGDLPALEKSLHRLSRLSIDCLLPGHGDILTGRDIIEKNFDIVAKEFF